ncbi:MAG TPA: HupE/UreJ family protein [Labilithrix sp.]
MKRALVVVAAMLVVLFAAPRAWAHKPSDSYLSLDVDGAVVHGRWDLALRDLDYALDLDADGDGKLTWGEVKSKEAEIGAYALARLAVRAQDAACTLAVDETRWAVAAHSDGTYAVLAFEARCPDDVRVLGLEYRLFFDLDPQHRGIVRVDAAGTSRTHVLSARDPSVALDLGGSGRARQFFAILREGVFHIWQGYDHILFLLALLLPSVLRRENGVWQPVKELKPALYDVLRIVTSFTVAHSITLSLAALGIVTLPSRLVESAIAASVVLAAANNLHPILRQDRWMAAFLLGLMHGFGFSATLMDMGLPRSNLILTLFGFNAGVEVGQLAIVCVFVPLAFAARRTAAYRRVGLVAGSVAIVAVATVWLIERAFVVKILS